MLTSSERDRLKALERENLELQRSNEILRKAAAFFAQADRPPREVMVALVDAHRAEYGVEPICAELPIAPSMYYEHKARQADPGRLPPRVQRDADLCTSIQRVWAENFRVDGAQGVARGRPGGDR